MTPTDEIAALKAENRALIDAIRAAIQDDTCIYGAMSDLELTFDDICDL